MFLKIAISFGDQGPKALQDIIFKFESKISGVISRPPRYVQLVLFVLIYSDFSILSGKSFELLLIFIFKFHELTMLTLCPYMKWIDGRNALK